MQANTTFYLQAVVLATGVCRFMSNQKVFDMKKIYLFLFAAMFAATTLAQAPALTAEAAKQLPNVRVPLGMTPQKAERLKSSLTVKDILAKPRKAAKKADAEQTLPTELITEQPEGTLYKNLYRHAKGYYMFWGYYLYYSDFDGYLADVVTADDGNVYLKNPFCGYTTDSWLKGTKAEGDTIEFNLPQKIYEYEYDEETKYEYYAYKMVMSEDGSTYVKDSTSQTVKFIVRNDSIIKVGNELLGMTDSDGEWVGYGDNFIKISKVDAASIAPASTDGARQCVLKYKDIAYSSETGEDPVLTDNNSPYLVNVVVDGSDVYIGGLDASAPDLWAKGTLDGNTVTFKKDTYMGVDEYNGVHVFLMPSKARWEYYSTSEIYYSDADTISEMTFDYDADNFTLTGNGDIAVNAGNSRIYYISYLGEPTITAWTETAGTPNKAEDLEFYDYFTDYGYSLFAFNLNFYTTDGMYMNPEKLSYKLYMDDDEYTFYPDEHTGLTEEMTEIPAQFTDSTDILYSNALHYNYLYSTGFKKIGVKVIYAGGGETHESEIAWYYIEDSGIKGTDAANNGGVKSVSYIDLSGRRVVNPGSGIFIKSVKYADGSVKNVKVVK